MAQTGLKESDDAPATTELRLGTVFLEKKLPKNRPSSFEGSTPRSRLLLTREAAGLGARGSTGGVCGLLAFMRSLTIAIA